MDRLRDWLALHDMVVTQACGILSAVRRGSARMPHCWSKLVHEPTRPSSIAAGGLVADAFHGRVSPALNTALGLCVDLSAVALRAVDDEPAFVPHAIDNGPHGAPEIVVRSPRTPADLLCLAHEAAHAAQALLSGGRFMPPLAREACAFLGEIALVEWARANEPALVSGLLAAWAADDAVYCGADLERLAAALDDPDAPYDYRMNYPIARAAAVVLFETAGEGTFRALFAAGEEAMGLLPLAAIPRTSALPPIPERDALVPATDAYRGLGVVALLDLVAENAYAQASIAEAYDGILAHLRTGTLHVGRDDVRRPVGYACWRETAPGPVEITRRVAPFDEERLDRALEARLSARAAPEHAPSAA